MKKKLWIIIAVLLALIIPIPGPQYKDGGTKEYNALTYKIVVWRRLNFNHKTSVFWFPDNLKTIDELWEMENGRNMGSIDNTSTDEISDSDIDEGALRETYPDYFDLSTSKGLEVYVWQMAPSSYSFGVLPSTDREKTLGEMLDLKGASAEEMRAILSSYAIDKDDILIIPWQNPISSYIPGYWVMQKDEDPASAEKRRDEYMDMIHSMLFDPEDAANEYKKNKEE